MLVDFTYLFIIMNIPIVFGLHSCGWVFWNPWQTYNDQFSVPEGSEDVGVGSAQSQTHDGQLQRNRGQAGHQWSIFWEKNDSFLLKTFGLSSKFKAKYSPCLVMVYRSRSVRSPFSSPVRRQSLEERSPGNIITEVGHLLLCLNAVVSVPVILWLTLTEERCLPLSVNTWSEWLSWLCPVNRTWPWWPTLTSSTLKLSSCAAGLRVRMYWPSATPCTLTVPSLKPEIIFCIIDQMNRFFSLTMLEIQVNYTFIFSYVVWIKPSPVPNPSPNFQVPNRSPK